MTRRYPKLVDLLKEDTGDTGEEYEVSSGGNYKDYVKKHGHTPVPSKVREFFDLAKVSGTTFRNEDGELLIDIDIKGIDIGEKDDPESVMQGMLNHRGRQLWYAIAEGTLLPDDIKKQADTLAHFQLRLVNPDQLGSLKPFSNPKGFGPDSQNLKSPRTDRTLMVILPGNVSNNYKEELQKVRSMSSTSGYQNLVVPKESKEIKESFSRGSLYRKRYYGRY